MRQQFLSVLLLGILAASVTAQGPRENVCPRDSANAVTDLTSMLQKFITDWSATAGKPKPPGLAAAVSMYDPVYGGDAFLVARGAAGIRKLGSASSFLDDDYTKIGSCSKSFTATAMAMLVEQGKLSFSSTLGNLLNDIPMNNAYKTATIRQLLGHRAGFIRDFDVAAQNGDTLQKRRERFAKALLATSPSFTVGQYSYSNAGAILAGYIVERFSGLQYEKVIQDWIFTPLGLNKAGVGTFGSKTGSPTAPWGHWGSETGTTIASSDYGWQDLTYRSPAGEVYMSQGNHALWAGFHLRSAMGGGPLTCNPWTAGCVSRANMAILHTNLPNTANDMGGPYALGWWNFTTNGGWRGNNAIQHNGGISGWYSIQYALPARSLAVTVVTNHVRFNWGLPSDVVEPIAQNLATQYTPAACYSSSMLPAQQVSLKGSCYSISSWLSNTRCTAGLLSGSTTLNLTSSAECAARCMGDDLCIGWSFSVINGTGTCTLIRRRDIVVAPGRRLQQLNVSTISCTSGQSGWTSGRISRSQGQDMIFQAGRTDAGVPYNLQNKAGVCSTDALNCQKRCIEDRVKPCKSWTWNKSTKQCFLFSSLGTTTASSRFAFCDLVTGTVSNTC
mmetsp:Transcript_40409/g.89759  ORF Transcript_40409/g.89759 Transcript_40409/m.89759 type:complete len:615 (-) Transcript_40409:1450-3294(-)|eukprot:CAMPEP_0202902428 /NCGR_PEP_ID=MMETSP1392-20130828/16846_1 /ASSEMBLY_ACC=CAM_ASM_000868 /TAXON_ID=225041 /ORGANISM="Chlamydomonas chlamydogama, Strain SAG 11-48b" /LENGTH=614 /DNA_ID=CAMNT_0049589187 /DNA_START=229 /DNA_END=2073 /DNA_ORIENTATION=-